MLECLLRDAERGVGGGDAAVDGGLQDELLDLVDREAVAACCPDVQGQLLVVAPRDQRGEGDQGAAATVEPRSGPDATPGVLGDELLEVAREVGRCADGPVDVRVAEHLAAHDHASGAQLTNGGVVARGRLLPEEVLAKETRHRLRLLGRCEVRHAVELDVPAVRDTVRDRPQACRRSGDVVRRRPPRGRVRAMSARRSRTSKVASAPQTWM